MADSSAQSSSRSTDRSMLANDRSPSSISKKKAKKTSKSGQKEEPENCFCKALPVQSTITKIRTIHNNQRLLYQRSKLPYPISSYANQGLGSITNEVIKSLPRSLINYLRMIFNKILNTREYPYQWATSVIQPIYKSGNRSKFAKQLQLIGIPLISCIGNLFTHIINNRFKKWAENSNVLCKEHFGF